MPTALTVAEAAARLGLSVQAVYEATGSGRLHRIPGTGPIMLDGSSVEAFANSRRTEARARLGDLVQFAARMHAAAWPAREEPQLTIDGRRVDDGKAYTPPPPRTQADARASLRSTAGLSDAVAVFGQPALDSLTVPLGSGVCRWCMPRLSARVNGTPRPEDNAAWRALFGTQPCREDRRAWKTEADAAARGRRVALAAATERARSAQQQRVHRAQAQLQAEQAKAAQLASLGRLQAPQGGRAALTASTSFSSQPPALPQNLTPKRRAEIAAKRRREQEQLRRDGIVE